MAQKRKDPDVGHDILQRYLCGGVWKRRLIAKHGKGRSDGSTAPARLRVLVPPTEGWKGGLPEDNGYRQRSKK